MSKHNFSVFNDEKLTMLVVAVLTYKLGGRVIITQKDIDEVAYVILNEHGNVDGSIEFDIKNRTAQ